MKVEIWSDVVCPWCAIGKRRFETALARFEHRDEVEIAWRSFELDPMSPRLVEGDLVDRLARKYGMSREQAVASQDRLTKAAAAEGLEFHFERARSGNTFDAHRLLHLADAHGRQDALAEVLFRAYFTDGDAIGDRATLARLAVEAGLDAAEVDALLAGDTFAAEVRADEVEAAELGATGVPFFVVDRAFAVAGAQSPDIFTEVLEAAWAASRPEATTSPTLSDSTRRSVRPVGPLGQAGPSWSARARK